MKELKPRRRRKPFSFFDIDQCSLYKLSSPAKLNQLLLRTAGEVEALLSASDNYKEFTLEETVDPFSGKKKKARAVQTPKHDLKMVHERLLKLLQRINPPPYAHAGIKRKSYRSNALVHESSNVIATFDLKSFYDSTRASLVHDFFFTDLKCAGDVASILTRLTTHKGCIPTGSPLSPLLALQAAKPMFNELNELALKNDLKFTCYVDDLTFSGEMIPKSLKREVLGIVKRFGYKLSEHKTRIYKSHHKKLVTGTIIYERKISVPHSRFVAARRIQKALDGEGENYGYSEKELLAKLSGLYNEASTLDQRFSSMAARANKNYQEADKDSDEGS
ncbi:reverse transcriptase family protein [Pseudomonas mosselii]|uniref:reverse transcriptase family protein n=1 Tax=Pseudomonas mosselii TaxID=78327 RepID=UPI002447C028|nr:reverse transcriptase family protein [Pseudomonas mosselii]MDH1511882.1 reverse transcriptase family protein [Pseudomonas mosselii]